MNPVVRLHDLPLSVHAHGDHYEAGMAPVAAPAGARRLGARYVEVPPGKTAWPYHAHHANDELFVILDGEGRLRHGGREYDIGAGDVVVCPAGGAEAAHQIRAVGAGPLRYLAVSSMCEPDVMEYPDSGKMTIFAGSPPGGDKAARRVELTVLTSSGVDYWHGEN